MEKVSIMIIGEKLIAESWAFLFEGSNRFEVVAECKMGNTAFLKAWTKKPAIILILLNVNITLDVCCDVLNRLKKDTPVSKVIIISSGLDTYYVKRLLQAGALGFLTKRSPFNELLRAIEQVVEGKKYVCLEIVEKVLLTEAIRVKEITGRQKEIIPFLKNGFSSKEIAQELGISNKTVEVYRYKLLKLFSVSNTEDLLIKLNNDYLNLGHKLF